MHIELTQIGKSLLMSQLDLIYLTLYSSWPAYVITDLVVYLVPGAVHGYGVGNYLKMTSGTLSILCDKNQ